MLLDTCFCIDLMRESHKGLSGPATAKMAELKEHEISISLFTLCELRAGAELSKNPQLELRKINLLTEYVEILYPDSSFPVIYGEAEAVLREKGARIPVMDLLIGITAKAAEQAVLTRDTEHFSRIPGLVVETY
ncbi:MAG TPA: hypothetical protein DCO79_09430 [Spirochaeta sp.]|nr:hypothetical protein [Spirochaeta sp.]